MWLPSFISKNSKPSASLTIAVVTVFLVSLVAVGVAADYVVRAIVERNFSVDLAPPPLPSDTEYEVAMAMALKPVLAHLESVDYAVTEGDAALLEKIDEAQQTIMTMRLRSQNPAHLATVLLLDKWRRAVRGSKVDQSDVAKMTEQLLADYPWLEAKALPITQEDEPEE